MFTISLKQEQYLTYILSDQKAHSRIEVVPERGGIITSWRIQGQEMLYLDKERFANPQLSIRGGIPILFPICGNLPNNTFTYQNKQYILKQHGFARDSSWNVVSQSTDNSAQIILTLKSNQETKLIYPFDFELIFSYEIRANKLTICQSYTNNSKQKMPFSSGFHPYFWCKDKSKLKLNIPATEYQDQITKQVYPFQDNLDYEREEIDIIFPSIKGNTAGFSDYERNLKLTINYSQLFSNLVFWTVKGKDYICLEPWSAPRNALNTGENLSYLEPGKTQESFVEMAVSYF
jgi:galactose mutarotase-like enzyme